MNPQCLFVVLFVAVRSELQTERPEHLLTRPSAEERSFLDSNLLDDEKESRHLGLLGLGSGYGCLQLLSYIRVLKLQLLYYSRALQLSSLGYGGLGLGGAWRTGDDLHQFSAGSQHRDDYTNYQDSDVPDYIDQYQYQS